MHEGRVIILDEQTGQPSPNRQWAGGLQQLIEVKEGLEPSDRRVILTRMSYQRFFQRYLRFGGLSDTAREAAAELWRTYRIPVISVPAGRDLHRLRHRDRVFTTSSDKMRAILERVIEIAGQGRPVLVAAPTVETANSITECLAGQGIEYYDLSTAEPVEVAGILAAAGRPGAITVATNMNRVGIDIIPSPETVQRGGLYVVIAEPHESRRADRRLSRRCGRGGEAGSHESFASLEDSMVAKHGGFALKVASWLLPIAPEVGRWVALYAVHSVQRRVEQDNAKLRWDLLIYDRETSKLLAFSGRSQ